MKGFTILFFCSCLCCLLLSSTAVDTITANGTLRDGETIVSEKESFELGFFSPPNSNSWYLGIWYKKIGNGTVVWIANRDSPLNDTSGVLQLTNQGTLVLVNGRKTFWSSNSSGSFRNPVAQLLDTGNLVVRDRNDNQGIFLWQSFDHLTDTLLAGVKFGKNFVTGVENFITSRKTADDPSSGDYTEGMDTNGLPQIIMWKGPKIWFREGSWNGLRFSGQPNLKENLIYSYEFFHNEEEVFYRFLLKNSSVLSRIVLTPNGVTQRFTWADHLQEWTQYLSTQTDDCDRYKWCGAYGSCNINNSPVCGCLKGFVPKALEDWKRGDWTSGCVREMPFKCGGGEGFRKIKSIKIPDTRNSWFNRTITLKECEQKCLKNCSCTAYTDLDIRNGGSGCLLWFDELIDVREYPDQDGQDIYIKLDVSELDDASSSKTKKLVMFIIIPVLVLGLVFLGLFLISRRRKLKVKEMMEQSRERDYSDDNDDKDLELPLFDFATITDATNKFSDFNKIGEGGYGPVYKGTLSNGQEIAVKRLSKDSTQGLNEFKNEVLCIAKLQHRNLVKLLGCCIQAKEKMLIYEYMPHKSLDFFIFDQNENRLLDWTKSTNIINGIARGLLYLHQDSRLRIIHRDLKAGNILLDSEMNPKISDFGMARIFGGNETEANTKIVVGTYGYMSPEYAIDGLFSIKSDVFSFGVLVLEIVSGRRNRKFHHRDHHHNLLGHAWRLYKEDRLIDLIDEQLKDSCVILEASCLIHVGLLCVQNNPEDRPTMANVVLMLTSEVTLPDPKEPGFFTARVIPETDSSSGMVDIHSVNNMSISLITAR